MDNTVATINEGMTAGQAVRISERFQCAHNGGKA